MALSGVPVPQAEDIWDNGVHARGPDDIHWGEGACTWAFPDNVAPPTDPLTGEFLLTTVPERTDASPFEYTVTYSLPGFVAMDSETKVSVGFGSGLEYQVDAVCCSDPDPMSPMLMLPVGVVPDMVCPYVVASNLPVELAVGDLGSYNVQVTFNEPMDCEQGIATMDAIGFKNPGPIAITQSWLDAECTTLSLDPVADLPEGMQITVTLGGSTSTTSFKDASGKAYTGQIRCNKGPDTFTTNKPSFASGSTTSGFLTSGDPAQVIATGFMQTPAQTSPDQLVGGPAGTLPQINNLNSLDPAGLLTIPGRTGNIIGDNAGEADTFVFNWTAATGTPRQYKLYGEYRTGGIPGGLPLPVNQTIKSADPDTVLATTLPTICTAQTTAGLPNFCTDAGSTMRIDNGLMMNFAVTAFNANAQEGNYSNAVAAGDNVPPACADQGDGFDNNPLAPVNGSAITNLPAYDLLSCYPVAVPAAVGECTLATSPDINLETLDEVGGVPGDNLYNTADWTTFGGVSNSIVLTMNEDLDSGQTLPAGDLDTAGAATLDGLALVGTGSSITNCCCCDHRPVPDRSGRHPFVSGYHRRSRQRGWRRRRRGPWR